MIPEIELKSTKEIEVFQNYELMATLKYVSSNSPYYKRLFNDHNIDVNTIKSIEDLKKIPFTTKDDLILNNDDFFCVPRTEIIDYATTSGTLGSPVTFGLTDKDLDRLAYNEAISFACADVQKGDIIQLMTTMDRRFMAGLAYFLGLRKLGASVIRIGAGVPELQWDSILKYQPNYLVTVPSFLLKMVEYAEKHQIDYKNSSVKGAICIGESLKNENLDPNLLANKISEKWPIKLYSTYASTEMSTAFTECQFSQGGHAHPELIITELVDDNNEIVKDGTPGELVITTLGVEGIPLIRFKTGDIVIKYTDECQCGRNTYRLGPVIGRKQQMIKYKGTTLYPPALHDILSTFEGIKQHYIEISTNDLGTDEITVYIHSLLTDDKYINEVKDHFRAKLRVTPKVVWKSIDEINQIVFNPLSRKPITFIDNRTK